MLVGLKVDDATLFDDSKPCRDWDSSIFSYILLHYDELLCSAANL